MALTMNASAEIKTVWSNDGIAHSEHVCGYELGVFVELNPLKRTWLVEHFQLGDSVGESSGAVLAG